MHGPRGFTLIWLHVCERTRKRRRRCSLVQPREFFKKFSVEKTRSKDAFICQYCSIEIYRLCFRVNLSGFQAKRTRFLRKTHLNRNERPNRRDFVQPGTRRRIYEGQGTRICAICSALPPGKPRTRLSARNSLFLFPLLTFSSLNKQDSTCFGVATHNGFRAYDCGDGAAFREVVRVPYTPTTQFQSQSSLHLNNHSSPIHTQHNSVVEISRTAAYLSSSCYTRLQLLP